MRKVLFIETVHPILDEMLEKHGYHCDHRHDWDRSSLLSHIHEYFGIVLRSRLRMDEEVLQAASSLKFIARSGSGLENIDLASAEARGVKVFNSPEGNADAVGEHAIAMLLAALNRIPTADREVRNGQWLREENRGIELSELTVGVIGYGVMGRSFAKKLSGFDVRVLAHDKYVHDFGHGHVVESTLELIYAEADVVSLHLPLTEETRYYANAAFFQSFQKPIHFLNTARGKHVDTAALVEAMKSGSVITACLDVLEYEKASLEGLEFETLPEPLQYLMNSDRVILSPHVAGWTHASYRKLSSVLGEKILSTFGNGQ
ncbi:MAG: NAD(P)-dependent oxidoreductase [Flavobacteriales bacterium]